MHALIHPLTELFMQHPKIGGVFGLLVAVLFGVLGLSSWNELQSLPEQPEQLSLIEVARQVTDANRLWVSIPEEVSWDCQSIYYRQVGDSVRTEIAFTNNDKSVLAIATFSKRLPCDELKRIPIVGFFSKMSERRLTVLAERGFDFTPYQQAKAFLDLCTFCGRTNSTLGVVLGLIFVPLGLAVYPVCLWAKHKRETQPAKTLSN